MTKIIKIQNKQEIKEFLLFQQQLYANDKHFVYPFFKENKKNLENLVLKEKSYTALLAEQDEKIVGTILYTYAKDKNNEMGEKTCFFSHFECIDESEIAKALFLQMQEDMKKNDIHIAEGTYSPYDPDNRRGILVEGFGYPQVILTSYNKPYYKKLFEENGFFKAYDTLAYKMKLDDKIIGKFSTISEYVINSQKIKISNLDKKDIEKEILDVYQIMQETTNENNYQEAPSVEIISDFASSLKLFLDENLIKIARTSENKPVGFILAIADYNQVFYKLKGKMNFFSKLFVLFNKNKIDGYRGILQYVIPSYQTTGTIIALYNELMHSIKKKGFSYFECSTILEDNPSGNKIMVKTGGKIYRRFRIYRKKI